MKPVVIDSSVTVKLINQIDELYLDQADKILQDVRFGMVNLLAPELSKYEIGNALLKKNLDIQKANDSFGTIYSLPITFVAESEELACQTYKIAQQSGVTYYDASFIALAAQEDATLVTDNPKHQGRAKGITVVSLKDY